MKITVQSLPENLESKASDSHVPSIDVAGDWLYATHLWVASAIAGAASIKGLDLFDSVDEKNVFEVLQDSTAIMSIRAEFVKVQKGATKAFQFDISKSPSLYLPIIVLAAVAEGTSVLSNISTVLKDEDFNQDLAQLRTIGLTLNIQDDLLIIPGCQSIQVDTIEHISKPDLLLAILLLALLSNTTIDIHHIDTLLEKYPNCIKHLNAIIGIEKLVV